MARPQAELRSGDRTQLTKPDERTALQAVWNAERDLHWSVDVAKGEIVSDGNNPHLATEQTYGDFELWVDWLMVSPNGDSGIYLRGSSAGADLGPVERARTEERRATRAPARSGTTTRTTPAGSRS